MRAFETRTSTRPKAKPQKRSYAPGEKFWRQERHGRCACCGRTGRIVWHHSVKESLIEREGGDPFDPRWAICLGAPYVMGGVCDCHAAHHVYGVRDTRLPVGIVPDVALSMAVFLLGGERAYDLLDRTYRNVRDDPRLAAYRPQETE